MVRLDFFVVLDVSYRTRISIFCHRSIRVNNGLTECTEAECRMKLFEQINDENLSTKDVFNLNVHLTDHTGTIKNVKLGDDVARKMLKCSVRRNLYDRTITKKDFFL